MEEVRRPDDNELCGHVEQGADCWSALTIFGAVLGTHDQRDEARRHVLDEGLASLAERWTLRSGGTGEAEVVCIVEARPGAVRVARGYYATAVTPTLTITADQLAEGEWQMHR